MPPKMLKPPGKPTAKKRSSTKRPRLIESPPQAAALIATPVVSPAPHENKNVKLLARIDYVTDPAERTLRWHYERADREYHVVNFSTFSGWCAQGGWGVARTQYQTEIERAIIAHRFDTLLEQRLQEMDDISEDLRYLREWVTPLRDKYGNVRRHPIEIATGDPRKGTYQIEPHPYAGLPVYALPFSSMDKLIASFLKLDGALSEKRDAALLQEGSSPTVSPSEGTRPSILDPKIIITRVTPEDRKAMAKALLLRRQPELELQPVIEVDALAERDPGDDNGNTI